MSNLPSVPKSYLFPPTPPVPLLVKLTANTDFTVSLLGAIVKLAGFELNLIEVDGHGVFNLAGPGTFSGIISGSVAADATVSITVVDGDFSMTGGGDFVPSPLELGSAPVNGGYTVSGIGSPAMNGFYGVSGSQGGRARFVFDEYSLAWNSGASLYEFRDGSAALKWSSSGGEDAPEDVEVWFSSGGATGTPSLVMVTGTIGVRGQMAHYPGGISECKSASPMTWFPIPNSNEVIHQ